MLVWQQPGRSGCLTQQSVYSLQRPRSAANAGASETDDESKRQSQTNFGAMKAALPLAFSHHCAIGDWTRLDAAAGNWRQLLKEQETVFSIYKTFPAQLFQVNTSWNDLERIEIHNKSGRKTVILHEYCSSVKK